MSGGLPVPTPPRLDKMIAGIAPRYGARRYQARVVLAMTGQYAGAKHKKAALKNWRTFAGSADADTLGDLYTLRARARDLDRNNPIATGAKSTARTHTVGTGLKFRSQVDRDLLGLSEDQAETWERYTEKLFHLWASSIACDVTLAQNFYQLQSLVFDSTFESGDCFVLRRAAKMRGVVPLALAVIEADRIHTPVFYEADAYVRSGVKIDEDGAALSYFILDEHPGDFILRTDLDFQEVPAFGRNSGERMVLHVFRKKRPGQTRGVPELAPVIELLKQLDRYTEAELMAAVVASFFTVFLKTHDGSGFSPGAERIPGFENIPGLHEHDDVALGPGAVVNLAPGEAVETANPGRANSNFDAFFTALVRQIGVALDIPYELLVKHFTASYTASRAAIEMAMKAFAERREWLVSTFCHPVYEWFVAEAIQAGRIKAPGFFEDPILRAAWLAGKWIAPAGIVLDPVKEAEGHELAIEVGFDTLEDVTLRVNGGDWKQKTEQRGREHAARVAAKLEPEVLDPSQPRAPPKGLDGKTSNSGGDK